MKNVVMFVNVVTEEGIEAKFQVCVGYGQAME